LWVSEVDNLWNQINALSMLNAEGREKERRTVDELVNQYKVVLDGLLIHFPKVRLADGYESIAELKDHGRIDVVSA